MDGRTDPTSYRDAFAASPKDFRIANAHQYKRQGQRINPVLLSVLIELAVFSGLGTPTTSNGRTQPLIEMRLPN